MKLTVIMTNTTETYMRLVNENQLVPYTKRTVHIELTPGQLALIAPRKTGVDRGKDQFEIIEQCFLEHSHEYAADKLENEEMK